MINTINDNYNEDDTNSINNGCSICLGNLNNSTTKKISCNHIFHETCINEWLNNNSSCPLCRIFIKTNTIKYTNITISNGLNTSRNSSGNTEQTNTCINKFKIFVLFTLLILSILFNFCSSMYNIVIFYKTNYHINSYIKTLNDTELGKHSHNTYNADVLIAFDIFYIIMLVFININIFNKCKNNCCGYAGGFIFLGIIVVTNVLIRDSFKENSNEYLDDDKLNFDDSYNTNLMTSYIIFLTSYSIMIPIALFSYFYILNK